MIFVANSNVSGKVNLACPLKCATSCFTNPVCLGLCLKDCFCCKSFYCKIACVKKSCSEFKDDDELMTQCWDECSTKC
ncbi:hypothetical protein P3L10_011157 [Capsicum annuum]